MYRIKISLYSIKENCLLLLFNKQKNYVAFQNHTSNITKNDVSINRRKYRFKNKIDFLFTCLFPRYIYINLLEFFNISKKTLHPRQTNRKTMLSTYIHMRIIVWTLKSSAENASVQRLYDIKKTTRNKSRSARQKERISQRYRVYTVENK